MEILHEHKTFTQRIRQMSDEARAEEKTHHEDVLKERRWRRVAQVLLGGEFGELTKKQESLIMRYQLTSAMSPSGKAF
jgi:hypothetical protein